MIAYLDTSAVIPLLIEESSSGVCVRLWESADDVFTSHLTYVESAAALASARRSLRLTPTQHATALTALENLWSQVGVLVIDDRLVTEAAKLAASHALRGYDAVHCASAVRIAGRDLVAAAGDARLLDAWSRLGLETMDVNQ